MTSRELLYIKTIADERSITETTDGVSIAMEFTGKGN